MYIIKNKKKSGVNGKMRVGGLVDRQVRPADQKSVEQEKKKEKRRKKEKKKIMKMMKSEYLEWAGGPSFRPRRR